MTESVYKVIELIGTSDESWEKAAKAAVDRAGKSLRDPRKQILKAIEKSGVDFTSHDLRRTISTVADRIGIDQYTVGRLLNHKTTTVTQGYIISDAERLRQPLNLITKYLLERIEP